MAGRAGRRSFVSRAHAPSSGRRPPVRVSSRDRAYPQTLGEPDGLSAFRPRRQAGPRRRREPGSSRDLILALALEWVAYGVAANVVPYPRENLRHGEAPRRPQCPDGVLSNIPVGRVGTTTDVAGAVVYLASPAAALVNGTMLLVDGGWTAQ